MRVERSEDPRVGLRRRRRPSLAALLLSLTPLCAQQAAEPAEPRAPQGWRKQLEEQGLTLEAYYTLDLLWNTRGGADRGAEALGNFDLLGTAELGPLVGWDGARAFAYGLANHGGPFSDNVNDAQVASNIEAPRAVRLYEAWLELDVADARGSILAGLYDVNGEFDVIPSASLFVNSSHGIGAEFGNAGRNGPSVFPITSLAARVQWRPAASFYLRAMVADGVPGELDHPRSTRVRLDRDDGVLVAAEVGFLNLPTIQVRGRTRMRVEELPPEQRQYGNFGKYALGVWGFTTASGSQPYDRGLGLYALAEQQLAFEEDDPFDGLSVFARAGIADDDVSPFDTYLGAGLVYRGPIPGRAGDRVGLAVAAARFGKAFQRRAGPGWDDWEVAIELTWRAPITDAFAVQPGLQWIANPGGDPSLDDAWVVGLRGIVSF